MSPEISSDVDQSHGRTDRKKREISLKVQAIDEVAYLVKRYILRDIEGGRLPSFEPGAHLTFHLPNGLRRSYSLINPQSNPAAYVIAVAKNADSKGGSAYFHDVLKINDIIVVDPPANAFPLHEDTELSTFFAGGIGITPILAMIERLYVLGRPWILHYGCRDNARAAYLERVKHLAQKSRVPCSVNFYDQSANEICNIDGEVQTYPANTHFYCCGPSGMLTAFLSAVSARASEYVHYETFSSSQGQSTGPDFEVILAKSGRKFRVGKNETILERLLAEGIQVDYSCMQGVCTACKTRVIEGIPDHQDYVLSAEERDSGESMLICCSRSPSEKLILDL